MHNDVGRNPLKFQDRQFSPSSQLLPSLLLAFSSRPTVPSIDHLTFKTFILIFIRKSNISEQKFFFSCDRPYL